MFADRYERRSLLVTSNLAFSEWGQVFQGERMTAAILDRLHSSVPDLRDEQQKLSLPRVDEEQEEQEERLTKGDAANNVTVDFLRHSSGVRWQ